MVFGKVRDLRRLALAAVAGLILASGAPRAQDEPHAPPLGYQQDNRQHPCYRFSLNGRDYCGDPLGGPGLDPPRVYYIAYDGSPICAQIRDALNRALAHPEESARSVMRPLPDSILHARYPRDPTAKTYESKNPLYADPMFLSWEYLNGVSYFDIETDDGNQSLDAVQRLRFCKTSHRSDPERRSATAHRDDARTGGFNLEHSVNRTDNAGLVRLAFLSSIQTDQHWMSRGGE